jgi:ubiquinone biosynthesis accessory factor UbiJ
VQGDAALANDVSWLIDNLRWEVSDDLSRFVGPVAAQAIARVGRLLAQGLREALRLASNLAARRDPGPGAG